MKCSLLLNWYGSGSIEMPDGISIVKGVCSNCGPNIAEVEAICKKKLCLRVTIDEKAILLCYDCLKMLTGKMDDIRAKESGID